MSGAIWVGKVHLFCRYVNRGAELQAVGFSIVDLCTRWGPKGYLILYGPFKIGVADIWSHYQVLLQAAGVKPLEAKLLMTAAASLEFVMQLWPTSVNKFYPTSLVVLIVTKSLFLNIHNDFQHFQIAMLRTWAPINNLRCKRHDFGGCSVSENVTKLTLHEFPVFQRELEIFWTTGKSNSRIHSKTLRASHLCPAFTGEV